jgi:PKD repeat protein
VDTGIRFLAAALLLVIASIIGMLGVVGSASAQTTLLIPYLAADWKYQVVPYGGGQGFEAPAFDDSSFAVGRAGFGTEDFVFGCSLYHPPTLVTPWASGTDILLRKSFSVADSARRVQVGVAIDDYVQVFVNGQDVSGGLRFEGGCAHRDQFVFLVPPNILTEGLNLLAVRGRDGGTPNYIDVRVSEVTPPANDDFAAALPASPLPFTDVAELALASAETNEPSPSCAFGPLTSSVWYALTADTPGTFSPNVSASFASVVAVYSGNALTNLSEVGCATAGNPLTFGATAGTTYRVQAAALFGQRGSLTFSLDHAPPPDANFSFSPSDPSMFDAVQFYDGSFDPAQLGFASALWDFGDGESATDCCPTHGYNEDGDYAAQLSVTTVDGRSASTTQSVSVQTHDVAITRIAGPQTARVGQTRKISVEVENRRYTDEVHVELLKGVPGGLELVDSQAQHVPARDGSRTTAFGFDYTITPTDARIGKITFKAVATILTARDALPADNEAIATVAKITSRE